MNKKIYIPLIIIILLIGLAMIFTDKPKEKYSAINEQGLNLMEEDKFLSSSTKGIMFMIEFHEDTLGLSNFVDMLSKRDIPGMLKVTPGYIEDHCEALKDIKKHNIKIASGISSEPFWDMPYEEQLAKMKESKATYRACFGEEMDIFSSRYFAYDENTLKAAEELGIDYVLARGTTGNRATIYKPQEYDVKLISVSNINSPEYGTGSLCDYSYWARAGEPKDFEDKLFDSLKYDQITPVSHTYLGGLKKDWNQAFVNFLDKAEVEWQSFEKFTKDPDLILPFSKIPQNREVQYVEPKPNVPLKEAENVDNPCSVTDLSNDEDNNQIREEEKIEKPIVFHNNQGSMCLEMLEFFQTKNYEFVEYVTEDKNFEEKLFHFMNQHEKSEGVSESFAYYPLIFIQDKAFSGFNKDIEAQLETLITNQK